MKKLIATMVLLIIILPTSTAFAQLPKLDHKYIIKLDRFCVNNTRSPHADTLSYAFSAGFIGSPPQIVTGDLGDHQNNECIPLNKQLGPFQVNNLGVGMPNFEYKILIINKYGGGLAGTLREVINGVGGLGSILNALGIGPGSCDGIVFNYGEDISAPELWTRTKGNFNGVSDFAWHPDHKDAFQGADLEWVRDHPWSCQDSAYTVDWTIQEVS